MSRDFSTFPKVLKHYSILNATLFHSPIIYLPNKTKAIVTKSED